MSRTAPARVLRLALVIGDQMIDERKLAPGTVVTIGQSLDCTLAIAVETLPRRWVLIDAKGELRLAPGMTARRDGDRGRVTIGEITVLFQETDAHEEQVMTLPADLRPSVLRRLDRRLAAFVAGSIVLHAGIATAAWLHDGKQPRTRRIAQSAMIEPPMIDLLTAMDFAPMPDDSTGPPAPGQPPPPGVATPPTPAPHHGGGGGNRKPTLPEMTPEEYLKAMHGGGGGPGDMPALPAIPDIGDDPGPGGDDDRGPRTHDPIGPRGPGDPDVDGPGDVQHVDKDPLKPPPRDPTPPPDDPDPPVDRDWIAEVVQKIKTTYMPGLERCQKKLLVQDPFATNTTVKLSLTVGADGKVNASKAKSDEPTVNSCVGDQMESWSFSKPPSGKDSHVAVTLALQGS